MQRASDIYRRPGLVIAAAVAAATLGAVSGSGAAEQEERPVAAFSRLKLQNGVDAVLAPASTPSLRIEVDGMDLADVETEVVDGELRIRRRQGASRGLFRDSEATAYVGFVELSSIDAAGGSHVRSEGTLAQPSLRVGASGGSDVRLDLEVEDAEFDLSGGSDLRAEGSVGRLTISASGGSDVAAKDLSARDVELRLSGGSDAEIYASESVDVDASGGSDVGVFGNPQVRNIDSDRSSDVHTR